MNGKGDIRTIVVLVMTSLVLCAGPNFGMLQEAVGSQPMPMLDAHIAGTVQNGTSGMDIEIMAMLNSDPPSTPYPVYFTGKTDGTGSFNITVHSNSTTTPKEYIMVGTYTVSVFPTYYRELVIGTYKLPRYIQSGETFHIPPGALEVTSVSLGNLTVRIMNASGNTPIENAVVTVNHVYSPIPPPFELSKLTDQKGEATWELIRAINTTVEAKKLHFQDLSTTQKRNYVTISKGGTTHVTFDLVEDPWPFKVDPSDGRTDVNVSEPLIVDFGQVMDRSSITDASNYRLSTDGITPIPISIDPAQDDRSASVRAVKPLSYDTDHILRLDTTLRTSGGGRPLWRAMEVRFRTELPPGTVSGRLVDPVTGDGAWGARVQISDQRMTVNSTGHFHFPIVPKGTYTLDVLDSYLYNETFIPGINVNKGSSVQLGSIALGPKPRGSLEVTVVSEAGLVEGATVKVLSTFLSERELNMTTGPDGKVLFPMVRAGNVNLRGSAPRHSSRMDIAIVKAGSENTFTLRLKEDPLPVSVMPTRPLGDGFVDPDTDLVIMVPEEIKFQTLDVKLWTLDSTGGRDHIMELAAPTKGSEPLTYVVNIPGKLPLETGFELIIDDGLLALDDLSPLMWRDLIFGFRTPDYPLTYVVGTVLLEGIPYKGLKIGLGPFVGAADASGAFNITVDLSLPSGTYFLRTNVSGMGYEDLNRELVITPGMVMDVGRMVLYPLPGWYSVSPPDGSINVEPSTNITFSFSEPVADGGEGWAKLLKVIPKGSSAPVSGIFTVSPDNRTMVFDPAVDLNEGQTYSVEVSSKLKLATGGPAMPVGNKTSFKVRQTALLVTLKEPAASALASLPLDGTIKLSFSARVNTTILLGAIRITPVPTGIRYEWPSSSELWVRALYRQGQSFELVIPVGQYGILGEPLRASFSISYTIGTSYSLSHAPESFQMVPEAKWVKGSLVRISGSSPSSVGYETTVLIKKGTFEVRYSTTILGDGTFNLTFNAPESPGEYTVIISIGIPGGDPAYTKTYEVEVKRESTIDGEGLDPLIIILAVILVLFISLVIIGGYLYIRAQRRKLSERPEIEYSDVDADWAQEE